MTDNMLLNGLLVGAGMDPAQVLVFRHRPPEPPLGLTIPVSSDQPIMGLDPLLEL
jgi:hypothetical protein